MPGPFETIRCQVRHPLGSIEVDLAFEDGVATGTIILPESISGTFAWNNTRTPLEPGRNNLS